MKLTIKCFIHFHFCTHKFILQFRRDFSIDFKLYKSGIEVNYDNRLIAQSNEVCLIKIIQSGRSKIIKISGT